MYIAIMSDSWITIEKAVRKYHVTEEQVADLAERGELERGPDIPRDLGAEFCYSEWQIADKFSRRDQSPINGEVTKHAFAGAAAAFLLGEFAKGVRDGLKAVGGDSKPGSSVDSADRLDREKDPQKMVQIVGIGPSLRTGGRSFSWLSSVTGVSVGFLQEVNEHQRIARKDAEVIVMTIQRYVGSDARVYIIE